MTALHKKTALITGAGRGLGAALAHTLAEQGCTPILTGRNLAALHNTALSIQKHTGISAEIFLLDLASPASITTLLTTLKTANRPLDILINNGATWLEASPEEHTPEDVLTVLNSAVTGTFLLTQGLLPLLRQSPTPDIVTIGSVSGLPNAALQTVSLPFYAAKRAQTALAEGLSQILAGTPVRSLVIHPPYLDDTTPHTPEWDSTPNRQKHQRATNRDITDATLFALTRPRHVSLTITVDSDNGGLHPKVRHSV